MLGMLTGRNQAKPCITVQIGSQEPIVISGEAAEYLHRVAKKEHKPLGQVLAHAIALQRAVVDEKDLGSWVVSERSDGSFVELVPV